MAGVWGWAHHSSAVFVCEKEKTKKKESWNPIKTRRKYHQESGHFTSNHFWSSSIWRVSPHIFRECLCESKEPQKEEEQSFSLWPWIANYTSLPYIFQVTHYFTEPQTGFIPRLNSYYYGIKYHRVEPWDIASDRWNLLHLCFFVHTQIFVFYVN